MLVIGNEEIDEAPTLGKTITCYMCDKRHYVEFADEVLPDGSKIKSTKFAFFKCRGKAYFCGIDGKDLRRHHA